MANKFPLFWKYKCGYIYDAENKTLDAFFDRLSRAKEGETICFTDKEVKAYQEGFWERV